jgi:outer membrane protein OmpA-like peptidoglycan-associated protein/opacity protein-like surface antigen
MKKLRLLCVIAAVGIGPALVAQNFSEEKFQLSPFAGASFYHLNAGRSDIEPGAIVGGRVTENFWNRFAFEQAAAWNHSQLGLYQTNTNTTQRLTNNITNFHLDGLAFFTDRGSRWRPYFAFGVGGAHFGGSEDAKLFLRNNSPQSAPNGFKDQTQFQFNFGGGVIYRLTDLLGLRGDVREMFATEPTYGINNNAGTIYLPRGNWLSSTETTVGVVFNIGGKPKVAHTLTISPITATPQQGTGGLTESNPAALGVPFHFSVTATDSLGHGIGYTWMVNGAKAGDSSNTLDYTPTSAGPTRVSVEARDLAPKNPAPPASAAAVTVYTLAHVITVSPITATPPTALSAPGVLVGTNVQLTARGTDNLGFRLRYEWTVNGQPAGDGSNTLTYRAAQAGQFTVGVRVLDADPSQGPAAPPASAPTVTVYVRNNPAPPTATCSAAVPGTVVLGQSAALRVNATVAPGNTPRIQWRVTEGSVTNATAAQTTFNSTGVNFPNSPLAQTKTVTATATVTDNSGATASCSTSIVVTTEAQTVHYGDILFAQGSSRVNNAAKRILYERLYPQLAGDFRAYTVVLVGHIDPSERGYRNLDRSRVMNTAAALTAAKDGCMALDASRIQADWVGASDTEYKEADSVGTVQERATDRIAPNDARLKNRRVEIWLVPAGKPMPASVKQVRTLPAADLAKLGCPK